MLWKIIWPAHELPLEVPNQRFFPTSQQTYIKHRIKQDDAGTSHQYLSFSFSFSFSLSFPFLLKTSHQVNSNILYWSTWETSKVRALNCLMQPGLFILDTSPPMNHPPHYHFVMLRKEKQSQLVPIQAHYTIHTWCNHEMGFTQSAALMLMWLKPNFLEDSTILIDLGRCVHIVLLCRLAPPEPRQKQPQNIKTPVRTVQALSSFLKAWE